MSIWQKHVHFFAWAILFNVLLPSQMNFAAAKTVQFAGYTWDVRPAGTGGPGPNNWNPHNVWVDSQRRLHLKLTVQNGQCQCAELNTQQRLGFGRYQFQLDTRPDNLDPNVVLGLFPYPTPDVGVDGTHEIDIEFARWGNGAWANLNYTVWPTSSAFGQQDKVFNMNLSTKNDYFTTHRLTWHSNNVYFQSLYGHHNDNTNQFASWLFQPTDPLNRISQSPMPLHLNLWCFQGKPPCNGQPIEVIISNFTYQPFFGKNR